MRPRWPLSSGLPYAGEPLTTDPPDRQRRSKPVRARMHPPQRKLRYYSVIFNWKQDSMQMPTMHSASWGEQPAQTKIVHINKNDVNPIGFSTKCSHGFSQVTPWTRIFNVPVCGTSIHSTRFSTKCTHEVSQSSWTKVLVLHPAHSWGDQAHGHNVF